jgi:hypothetical protein
MPSSRERLHGIASFLRGDASRWQDLEIDPERFLDLCREQEVEVLSLERLLRLESIDGWPHEVRERLSDAARAQAGEELLRGAEIRVVLEALANAGVRPLLMKGTPLAYGWYQSPASRPRADTDMLVAAADVDAARRVMSSLDYLGTVHCHDLFSQFEVQKRDRFGVVHAFDVHWKISTQPVFADVLTYEELFPRAVPVPPLGATAWSLCAVDALLLACVHPVMHHRNEERLLWAYDIHLLATSLARSECAEFGRLAREKDVAEVCACGLRLAQTMFRTVIPAEVMASLDRHDRPEPSAAYLTSERRWHHETLASLRALPGFGERARMLREVLLPSPSYMLGAYGLRGKPLAPWLLPVLYVHRNVRGAWKIIAGKK